MKGISQQISTIACQFSDLCFGFNNLLEGNCLSQTFVESLLSYNTRMFLSKNSENSLWNMKILGDNVLRQKRK